MHGPGQSSHIASSLPCQLSCCAAARQCRNPHQAPRFPPSRSKHRRQDRAGCAAAGANDGDFPTTGQPASSTAQNPNFAPGSALARLAKLEKEARSCNGGCETSFRVGNAPWVGCSYAAGGIDSSHFSATCTDTLSYNTYAQCVETKAFLGAQPRETRWICTSLLAGGKLPGEKRVAEIQQLGRR